MHDRPVRIFAYGSLRPGFERHDAVAEFAPKVTPATLAGYSLWLYDEGGYPVAISDDLNYSSDGYPPIIGALLDFPFAVAAKALARLDRIEGVRFGAAAAHWLRRDVVTVTAEDGPVRAWCYVGGERIRALRLKDYLEFIASGDWADMLLEGESR